MRKRDVNGLRLRVNGDARNMIKAMQIIAEARAQAAEQAEINEEESLRRTSGN